MKIYLVHFSEACIQKLGVKNSACKLENLKKTPQKSNPVNFSSSTKFPKISLKTFYIVGKWNDLIFLMP